MLDYYSSSSPHARNCVNHKYSDLENYMHPNSVAVLLKELESSVGCWETVMVLSPQTELCQGNARPMEVVIGSEEGFWMSFSEANDKLIYVRSSINSKVFLQSDSKQVLWKRNYAMIQSTELIDRFEKLQELTRREGSKLSSEVLVEVLLDISLDQLLS